MSTAMTPLPADQQYATPQQRYVLWVDGVGGYLLLLAERVTIGGPGDGPQQADLTLLANLSRRHASLARSGEGYVLEPHAATCVGNRLLAEPSPLCDGYTIRLGDSVALTFRVPSVLSNTAVLEFQSDHRPVYSVDGVIMMEESCLLGPGRQHHVVCDGWSETVVLYRRDGGFWCKSRNSVCVSGTPLPDGGPIRPGDVVSSGPDVRFRIEALT